MIKMTISNIGKKVFNGLIQFLKFIYYAIKTKQLIRIIRLELSFINSKYITPIDSRPLTELEYKKAQEIYQTKFKS